MEAFKVQETRLKKMAKECRKRKVERRAVAIVLRNSQRLWLLQVTEQDLNKNKPVKYSTMYMGKAYKDPPLAIIGN